MPRGPCTLDPFSNLIFLFSFVSRSANTQRVFQKRKEWFCGFSDFSSCRASRCRLASCRMSQRDSQEDSRPRRFRSNETASDEDFVDDPPGQLEWEEPGSPSLVLAYSQSDMDEEVESRVQGGNASDLSQRPASRDAPGPSPRSGPGVRGGRSLAPASTGTRSIHSFFAGRGRATADGEGSQQSQSQSSTTSTTSASSTPGRPPAPSTSQPQVRVEDRGQDPYPYLAPMWRYVGKVGEAGAQRKSAAFQYQCRRCTAGKAGLVSVTLQSKSNLKTHLRTQHGKESVERYDVMIKKAKNNPAGAGVATLASSSQESGTASSTAQRAAQFFTPRNRVASQEELNQLVSFECFGH